MITSNKSSCYPNMSNITDCPEPGNYYFYPGFTEGFNILILIIAIWGVWSNGLTILILAYLTKRRPNCAFNPMMIILAGFSILYTYARGTAVWTGQYFNRVFTVLLPHLIVPVLMFSGTAVGLMTTTITAERYIALHYPNSCWIRSKRLTVQLAVYTVPAAFCLPLIVGIIQQFAFNLTWEGDRPGLKTTDLFSNPTFLTGYGLMLGMVCYLIPIIVTAVMLALNIITVQKRRRARLLQNQQGPVHFTNTGLTDDQNMVNINQDLQVAEEASDISAVIDNDIKQTRVSIKRKKRICPKCLSSVLSSFWCPIL